MTLHTYPDIEQGTPEWHDLRRGIVTASTVGQLVTPGTLKTAANDKSRAAARALIAERITGRSEPFFMSRDMERGHLDEPIARAHYAEHHAHGQPVTEVGFMVRDDWGYPIGFSPDGLVGDDGLIEIKSRQQKKHLDTIIEDRVPPENMAQIQTGLLVTGRAWCEYLSWSGGMPMYPIRVTPDPAWQAAIVVAVEMFEIKARAEIDVYRQRTEVLPPTTYVDHFADLEMVL